MQSQKEEILNTLNYQPASRKVVAGSITDEDRCWAKEVSFPLDELTMAAEVPLAFARVGYKVQIWGKTPSHPCWILRARRTSAPRFADNAQLVAHVIEVLRSAGVRAGKADVTIENRGDTIQVTFLWPLRVRAWHFDESYGWKPDPHTT